MAPAGPPGHELDPACPHCPICAGTLEVVYDRFNQRVSVCKDCQSGLTVPSSAWEVLRLKREKKWQTEV